ncbi:hypothetical protein H6W05_003546 [Salmonella enterica]|nr:hypothetical protein [Salmonella enterica]EKB5039424.1 hypothetical protein [Salmonella enterica]EME1065100.1 hypothetical protein [Salmonella enterica]
MAYDKETERKLLVAEYYELKEQAEDAARMRRAMLYHIPHEVRRLDGGEPIHAGRLKTMVQSLEDADHSLRKVVHRVNAVAALCGKPEITVRSLLFKFGKRQS